MSSARAAMSMDDRASARGGEKGVMRGVCVREGCGEKDVMRRMCDDRGMVMKRGTCGGCVKIGLQQGDEKGAR